MPAATSTSNIYQLDAQALKQQFAADIAGMKAADQHKLEVAVAEWNRDAEMASRIFQPELARNAGFVLPAGVQRDALSESGQQLLDRYAMADTLALVLQQQLRNISTTVLLLASGGLICFELAHWLAHLPGGWAHVLMKITASAFFLAWLVAILLERSANHQRVQERYQDYRALAESLRVQFYWHWAGIEQPPRDEQRRLRQELLWLRFAVHQWTPAAQTAGKPASEVLHAWTDLQLNYFCGSDRQSGAILRNQQSNAWCKRFGRLCLYSSIALGALTAAVVWTGHAVLEEHTAHHAAYVLMLLAGLGIVLAALCYAWRERFAYAEHVKLYSAMARIYQDARERSQPGQAHQERPEVILQQLGHEALAENTEWLLLHRDRHATAARL